MVGKVRAKKLEEKERSRWNRRRAYSLLAGIRSSRHNITQYDRAQPFRAFPGEAYRHTAQSTRPSEYLVMRMRSAKNEILYYTVIIYKTWVREPERMFLANLLSPHNT